MACLLQRITSMKLQNNWYVWQINLHLSSSCLVAHKAVRPLQSPSTFLGQLLRSSLPHTIAILLLPFPFQLCASRWFLVFLFFFFFLVSKLVIAMLQWLFWSCLSILCPMIFHLCCIPSLLKGFMSALFSRSSALTW